jgi:hemerythrin-like domain-containing protein
MPVVIGAKPQANFSDPIGVLTDCHRRIERFLGVLVRVASDARGGALTEEQRIALDTALKYFREAAPKHTDDEENSLFPRLRAAGQALTELDALHDDHGRADRAHAEVDRLGREWLDRNSLAPADAGHLSELLTELSALYRAHIEVEEKAVFPLAAQVLPAGERVAMGKEMSARRGI